MLKITVLLLTLTIISLLTACNIIDTGAGDTELQNTLTSQQEAIFSKGAGPNNPGQGEFYPLAMGNSWTYRGERSMSIGDYESYYLSVQEMRSIIGTEELFGREYILEEQISILSGGIFPEDTITYWLRHRQDRAGLYNADIAVNIPPGDEGSGAVSTYEDLDSDSNQWNMLWQKIAVQLESFDDETIERARIEHFKKIDLINELLGRGDGRALLTGPPGGILPDEIQRLRYPMHPEQEWVIRDSPLFFSVVEGMDVLDLPAGRMNGWRIFIYNEFLDDNDIVHIWYGRSGFLGMTIHLETEIDGVSGTVISDEDLFLESYDLEGKGNKEAEKENGKETESNGSELTAR